MVNLAGGWNTLWSAISGAIGGSVMTLLTIAGVILVLFAVTKYVFDKRRGGSASQGLGIVLWTLVAGSILAAPQVILPLALGLLDLVINLLLSLFNAVV